MSSLTAAEKAHLEKLLRMGNGYVLEFSNGSLQNFVATSVGLDILDEKYKEGSGSKAHRMRALWRLETDEVVGRLLSDLLKLIPEDWARRRDMLEEEISDEVKVTHEHAQRACARLVGQLEVEPIDNLKAVPFDEDFRLLARQIKGSIDNGEPAAGLDRLHTFMMKYSRHLCAKHGVATTKEESLNAVFGKYVRALQTSGKVMSTMTLNILKFSSNILSAFNAVRNDQSLAHDNTVLNAEESLLILRNVSALVKFVEHVEQQA